MKVRRAAFWVFAAAGLARAADSPRRMNPAAAQCLDYITKLAAGPTRRILSGQFTAYAPHASAEAAEAIGRTTGRWPAFIGVDYRNFDTGRIDVAKANEVAIAYWKAGGLVEVGVHLPDPLLAWGGGLRERTVDLADLLPGGRGRAAWLKELDEIAAGLQQLRAAGVVVLWRPFHEMNGTWFWWGGKPPPEFIGLWRDMFDLFSNGKSLDNLLWLYSPNMGKRAGAYYPGADCVDLVGLDAYTDEIDAGHIVGYDDLIRLGKPFGFGEFGPHGSGPPPGDYDFRRLADGIRAHFPLTSFFMCWNDGWSPTRNRHAREFFADPWLVNRANLPPHASSDRHPGSRRKGA